MILFRPICWLHFGHWWSAWRHPRFAYGLAMERVRNCAVCGKQHRQWRAGSPSRYRGVRVIWRDGDGEVRRRGRVA